MPFSLPAEPAHTRRLTDVWPNVIAAVDGDDTGWFPPARSGIVLMVDGLGARNLSSRRGHARFLADRLTKRSVAHTTFPSTTATALTSLMTARPAGEHGIVGYRVRVPGSDVMANQLSGWEDSGLDPLIWQRSDTVFERESVRGRACVVVTRSQYRGTGFTTAAFRGGQFIGIDDLAERVEAAVEAAASHPGALVYLYHPDLDRIGHAHGWESEKWAAALEKLDAAAAALHAQAARRGVGVLATADHGMVDVPRHRHVLLGTGDALLDGVRHLGGEPRVLHLYVDDEAALDEVICRWRASEGERSWVLTRAEAIDAGLFGRVDPEVRPRIGDVVVAARARIAYYDDRVNDTSAQHMVGQHGSLTDEERAVPLIGLGAFAQA
ncbi:MAG: alkaline phosphatase family protein [Microbacterium sp.]|uniref:alkaline phosphatase family protein n=1 Tax=Microbacterium sp. TaxID=51671 RepID=UPI003A885800